MGSVFFIIGISVFVIANCQSDEQVNWGIGVSQHLLKDLKMLTNDTKFYEDLCEDCLKTSTTLVQHPENCGIAVYCVRSLGIFLMKCNQGTLFSEDQNTCVNPDDVVCRMDIRKTRTWSPCADKTPFRHPTYCRKYMVCSDPFADAVSSHAAIIELDCPKDEGFDTATKRCSPNAPCLRFAVDIFWIRKKVSGPYCGPIGGTDQKYWYNVTARYRRDETKIVNENYQNGCPASTYYPKDSTDCKCVAKNTETKCYDYTLANFASQSKVLSNSNEWKTWDQAKNIEATISGNATINRDKGAYFEGTMFTVNTLTYNEMGKYFTMSFEFLPQRRNPSNPAGQMINGALPGTYALADNSACGFPSTFGCRLVVDSQDFGKVMCSINSTQSEDRVITYNYHTESSRAMQLNEPIKVTLTRNNKAVKMEVEQRGNVDKKEWTMNKEDRIMGTKCGLTLAAGTGQKYFTGFIDNLKVTKFCPV